MLSTIGLRVASYKRLYAAWSCAETGDPPPCANWRALLDKLNFVVSIRRELLGSDAPEFRAAVEALAMHGLKSSLSAAHHGFKRSPVLDRETHLTKILMSSRVRHVIAHILTE